MGELACFVPEFVVTAVDIDLAVVNVADVRADAVQEVTVVRNDNHGVFETFEVVFEPVDAFEVHVVRRFVEQKDVRITEESLGKENSNFFVAVEFLHELLVGFFRDVETLEEGSCGRFGFVTAHFAKLGFEFDGFHAFVFGHFRLRVKFFAALADLVKFRVAHHDRVENGMFFVGEVILLQNRKTFVRIVGNVTRIRFQFSGKDLQERGLSGTVCADNPVAITLAEREVDIFEKHAASILQTNIRNIEHGAKDSNYSERLMMQASRMRHISSGE